MYFKRFGSLTAGFWLLLQPWSGDASEFLSVDPYDANCGNSNDSTYCSIQRAIDSAMAGATIRVAEGEYDLWGESLLIDKNLTLHGAGADKTILEGGGDHPEPLITILESVSVGIYGLSLINRVRSGSRDMGPGAIDHNGNDLTVSDVVMRDNQGGWGGAVRIRSEFGEVKLDNVIIENNSAFAGAGIAYYDGPGAKLTIANSTFRDNSAVFSGGALFFRDLSEVQLTGVELIHNRSGNTGGAVHVFTQTTSTEMRIINSRITKNISGGTGGISVMGDDAKVTLERTELSGNTSEDNPVKSDCSADHENMFVSKGNNRVGIGDGCLFVALDSDSVGTLK